MAGKMATESLRVRVMNTILGTFAVLTAVIAAVMFFALNKSLETELKAQAEVVARALSQSAEVSVGARQGNAALVREGLGWVSTVGEDLIVAVVLSPEGKPLAAVTPEGVVNVADLDAWAGRTLGLMDVEHKGTLVQAKAAPTALDALDAINSEAEVKPTVQADPQVRVVMTRRNQLFRQTLAVVLTGVVLCIIAIVALAWITAGAFRRVEPALETARRMAQGDFSQRFGEEKYRELAALFSALNDISSSLSQMIGDVRGLGDEVSSAVDRITGAASNLRAGAEQGTRAVAATDGAVAAMQKSVDESARKLTDLAATAEASSRDTETIERTNESTGAAVLTLSGEVERHARSLGVIGDRVRALSGDARSVSDASEAARGAAQRMQKTALEGSTRASEAARLADDAMRDSQVGGKAIEDAVARIQQIASHAGTMEGNLDALTERVEGMTPVLGAITDVTSRTSLLALNAGIIAAQAGERGAAFQVVVDELKSLASRTSQLTGTVEQSVRTVLEQRGKTEDAADALRRVVAASIEDAHRAGAALDAIRTSTAQSQAVSASIAETLTGQERDVRDTLARMDVLEQSGRSVEATARALADEVRVLREVADRVTTVSEEVARASREQGELAQRVGEVLALVGEQVRELNATHAAQHGDVLRVERSLGELKKFADDAKGGAQQLENVVGRMRQKAAGLSDALHQFRTR
jgi:methyl-accepting chemotaxis protein